MRISRGYLLPRTDSSLNRTNSVTYIAAERTRVTGNISRDHHPPLRDVTAERKHSLLYCCVLDMFTELFPGNALIKCVKIYWSSPGAFLIIIMYLIHIQFPGIE
jgi:hypothetical protein